MQDNKRYTDVKDRLLDYARGQWWDDMREKH